MDNGETTEEKDRVFPHSQMKYKLLPFDNAQWILNLLWSLQNKYILSHLDNIINIKNYDSYRNTHTRINTQTCSVPLKLSSLRLTTVSTDQGRDEIMFTLTKKKHTLHPKNEQGKQASGAASEVEKYSSHEESAQKARHAGDWRM